MMSLQRETLEKVAFVTIGATAEFRGLIEKILSEEMLKVFAEKKFTRILIQYGAALDLVNSFHATRNSVFSTLGIEVDGFDYNSNGLRKEMLTTKWKEGVSEQGVVISHAGAGTILDAMRISVPIIVVPNMSLLDNHQEELADELERMGYVTKSTLEGLEEALSREELRAEKSWNRHQSYTSLPNIIDETIMREQDVGLYLD